MANSICGWPAVAGFSTLISSLVYVSVFACSIFALIALTINRNPILNPKLGNLLWKV
jgi:hypothetical protein